MERLSRDAELPAVGPEELAEGTGREGAHGLVAFEGLVYDVSRSPFWRDGVHQRVHAAGEDLTGLMRRAPHTKDLLERVPLVGRFEG